MAYDSTINRESTSAGPLIPEEVLKEIWKNVEKGSFCLGLMRRLAPMSRKALRMPILAALPVAYWVDGEAGDGQTGDGKATYNRGLLQATNMAWKNKWITAEKMGVICPVPGDVVDDADYDVLGEYVPEIGAAIGRAIDAAVVFGTSAPTSFPDDIITKATAAGNVITSGELEANVDLYDEIWGAAGMLQAIRDDGYRPDTIVGSLSLEGMMDGLRDSNGNPLITSNPTGAEGVVTVKNMKVMFPDNGVLDPSNVIAIAGAFKQAVYSFRKDITFTKHTEGVVTDNTGAIVYNAMQQDITILKATIRWGWQLPNPINVVQPTEGDRAPWAVLVPAPET